MKSSDMVVKARRGGMSGHNVRWYYYSSIHSIVSVAIRGIVRDTYPPHGKDNDKEGSLHGME